MQPSASDRRQRSTRPTDPPMRLRPPASVNQRGCHCNSLSLSFSLSPSLSRAEFRTLRKSQPSLPRKQGEACLQINDLKVSLFVSFCESAVFYHRAINATRPCGLNSWILQCQACYPSRLSCQGPAEILRGRLRS
jgi:hypothetical protein